MIKNQTADNQSIVALCTPQGSGALGLIRITGADAVSVGSCVARLSSGKKLLDLPTHTIHHGAVVDSTGKLIDDVLFLLMRGPKTFTGDDTVEITCHNNPFIIQEIINAACQAGARIADPGEFTKRAFLNGKVDLIQAEAINDIIHAQSQEGLKRSLQQLKGTLSHEVLQIEQKLVHLLAHVEASFDFLDEEQRDLDFNKIVTEKTSDLINHLDKLLSQHSQQKIIKEGVRIALVGAVNAGKSTLFNKLVGAERAIVTDIAGTTRDCIEAITYKNGLFQLFVDTAGLRSTDDIIEKIGIEKSFQQAAQSDIVLLVVDAARPLLAAEEAHYQDLLALYHEKAILVLNKSDQQSRIENFLMSVNQAIPRVHISALENSGIDTLVVLIQNTINKIMQQSKSPYLLSQRQVKLLYEIFNGLKNIADTYSTTLHYELIAYNIKHLLERFAELTGRDASDRIMDAVFNEFCVGK